MSLLMVGLSHKTAPLELREALALDEARSRQAYEDLKSSGHFRDLVLLSTCNRVEVYAWSAQPEEAQKTLKHWMEGLDSARASQVRKSLQVSEDDEALWHLLQVAASLDSMVLGESQILGQVKQAYQQAVDEDAVGSFFHGLFQKVFAAAKEVRSSTELGRHPASVPSIAVSLAERIFGELSAKSALVVGAGEMAELTADYLKSSGVEKITFCNRSLSKAKDLAKHFSGEALPLERLEEALASADVAVFSTSAQEPLLDASMAEAVSKRRHGKAQLYLDLGVPRNIDPAVKKLEPAYLYNMDDLSQMSEEHREKRLDASREARSMLRRRYYEIREWIGAARLNPTLASLTKKMEALRQAEWEKQSPKLKHLKPEDLERVEYLTQALVKKILNTPLGRLKESLKTGRVASHVESIEALFDLKEED
jgi:glutamyl-tRNA reductase